MVALSEESKRDMDSLVVGKTLCCSAGADEVVIPEGRVVVLQKTARRGDYATISPFFKA